MIFVRDKLSSKLLSKHTNLDKVEDIFTKTDLSKQNG